MRIFYWGKDGGKESTVWGFWLIEIKCLFSVVLLKFENGTREAFHNHAFDAISWVLTGQLEEEIYTCQYDDDRPINQYKPSLKPVLTLRSTFHKVRSEGTSWVLSFRGPWAETWNEYTDKVITLKDGREEVKED